MTEFRSVMPVTNNPASEMNISRLNIYQITFIVGKGIEPIGGWRYNFLISQSRMAKLKHQGRFFLRQVLKAALPSARG